MRKPTNALRRGRIWLAALLTVGAALAQNAKKPNVLFIVCDDLNTRVGPAGYEPISTPVLDRLAEEGMTLQRAYCQYPVCGPSRASFLSGLYPESTGVLDNAADLRETRPGTKTFPELFKESGYWTGGVGKIYHTGKVDPGEVAWDERHFFENDELPMVAPIREQWEKEHGKIGSSRENERAWKKFELTIAPQTANQKPGYGPTGLRDDQHKDGKNARQIVSWLKDKAHGGKPFFMACGIHKPHGPFLAPDAYFDRYPKAGLEIKPASASYWEQAPKIAQTKRYEGFGFVFGEEDDDLRRSYTQAYHACISFVDAQIGLILDALKSEGHWDDTIVVLVSDHGYLLGEKFMWGKVFLWDMGTRVPMIVRVPGMTKPGSTSQSMVELVDIYPTLAELCGLAAPVDLQGESLVPILKDPAASVKQAAYTVVLRRGEEIGHAVNMDRWHYVAWPDGAEELYDLKNDPDELINLARSAEHEAVLEEMKGRLEEIHRRAKMERP